MPLLLAGCAVAAAVGCNELVRPEPGGFGLAPSFELGAAAAEQGCARFDIHLHGRDSITVDSVTAAPSDAQSCGTIRPVIVGKPTYDRARRVIGLPIALENVGQRALRAPARVYGWEDSLVISAPPGLVGNEYAGYVDFTPADSSISTTSSRFSGALLWRFDTLLAASNEPQVLAAGARSRVRWIELAVMPGVLELRATLWGEAVRTGTPVPLVAADNVADDVWAALTVPQNIFSERAGGPRFVRNAVWVVFQANATQADRQAAIDLVSGDVIGGAPLGQQPYGGTYLVRLPGVTVTPPDSALGPMLRARARLRELPTVKYVWPVILDPPGPAFRRPNDSTGFDVWRVDKDSADGANWALEAINAPLGWGCTIGNENARVAVVDEGTAANVPDLAGNIASGAEYRTAADTLYHGTHVSSVLAAQGDNSRGMTGVLWRARIGVFNARRPVAGSAQWLFPIHAVIRAGRAGYPVVNLSMGRSDSLPPTFDDSVTAETYGEQLATAIVQLQGEGHRPLIVVSASNWGPAGVDALYGGFPLAARDPQVAPQILVVGATARVGPGQQELAGFSNRGALVNVVAPGASVAILDSTGQRDVDSGTSYAAPLVSGIAAAVLAFDPSVPVDSLRTLVVQGAVNGGRTVSDPSDTTGVRRFPIVDMHETLKLAASRRQAPLCGNRVWSDNRVVYAQRGQSQEALFNQDGSTHGDYTSYFAHVRHGGRRVEFGSDDEWGFIPAEVHVWDPSFRTFLYSPNATPEPADHGATYLSALGTSHDFVAGTPSTERQARILSQVFGSLTVQFRNPDFQEVSRTRRDFPYSDYPSTAVVEQFQSHLCDPVFNPCRWEDGASRGVGTRNVVVFSRVAIAPTADYALVAVAYVTETSAVAGDWRSCGTNMWGDLLRCRDLTGTSTVTSSEVWRIRASDGSWDRILTVPNTRIGWAAVDDAGKELVLGVADPTLAGCPGARIEYRGFAGGQVGSPRHVVPLTGVSCHNLPFFPGQGTVAPHSAPTAGPLLPDGQVSSPPSGPRERRLPVRRGVRGRDRKSD